MLDRYMVDRGWPEGDFVEFHPQADSRQLSNQQFFASELPAGAHGWRTIALSAQFLPRNGSQRIALGRDEHVSGMRLETVSSHCESLLFAWLDWKASRL